MTEILTKEGTGEALLGDMEHYPQHYDDISRSLEEILTKLRELAKEISFRGVAAYLAHASGRLRMTNAVRVLSCVEGLSRTVGVATGIVEALLKGSLEREEAANMLEGVKEGLRVVSCPESEAPLHLKTYTLVSEALRCLGELRMRNEYGSMLAAGMAAALAAKIVEGGEEVKNAIT